MLDGVVFGQESDFDWTSLLLNVGIAATFIVFAIALLLIRREAEKKKTTSRGEQSLD